MLVSERLWPTARIARTARTARTAIAVRSRTKMGKSEVAAVILPSSS